MFFKKKIEGERGDIKIGERKEKKNMPTPQHT